MMNGQDLFHHEMMIEYDGFELYANSLEDNVYWKRVSYLNYNVKSKEGIVGPSYLVVGFNFSTGKVNIFDYKFPLPKTRLDLESIFTLCDIQLKYIKD